MTAKKKASKKKTARKSRADEWREPAPDSGIPEGMKQLGGSYAPSWQPKEPGETIHGVVSDGVRSVDMPKRGRMPATTRRVVEVTRHETGQRVAVWESAALTDLFDALDARPDNGKGSEVYIAYDGLGKKKAGQNPPKLFTVALAA